MESLINPISFNDTLLHPPKSTIIRPEESKFLAKPRQNLEKITDHRSIPSSCPGGRDLEINLHKPWILGIWSTCPRQLYLIMP